MATISSVTDRADGEILTAAKYNADHAVGETNANNLNDENAVEHVAGVHGNEPKQSMGLTSSDVVSFSALNVTGDISRFASIDMNGSLIITGDQIVDGAVRLLGTLTATQDIVSFATADFLGTVTADTLVVQQVSPGGVGGDTIQRIWKDTHTIAHLFYLTAGSIERNHNIASVTNNATGLYQVSFQVALGNASPDIQVTPLQFALENRLPIIASIDRNTSGQVSKVNIVFKNETPSLQDPNGFFLTVHGLPRSS